MNRNIYTHLYIALLAIISIITLESCHSQKANTKDADLNAIISAASHDWHDVKMPVKVAIDEPMSMSMSGRATLVRDSLINISMRVFGMEVAVVNITADSVLVIDKYHKYYFNESLSNVMGSHKITVGEMQNIMLGRVGQLKLEFSNPGREQPVTVTYSDFTDTKCGPVAGVVDINAPIKHMNIQSRLLWSPSSAQWNTYPAVNIKIPGSKYKLITTDNIKSMLSHI
ncbi:MAG: DUF4292 domain-containing protein [Muribaculaceae bacterium]|nr:DUF4292 domain-containing protein [Muribaculaceae bacterium]